MSVIDYNSIINLVTVDSTNNYATNRLVIERWSEGTVVLAEEQHKGKGQMKNRWESEKGKNILLSLVLYPSFVPVQHQFEISKVVALAVYEVVSRFVKGVRIKWPNDIYVEDRKISGILIENAIMGSEICWVVAGVGLNVNQTVFRSDAPNPVSLSMLTNKNYDRKELLDYFLQSVDNWYSLLKNGVYELIDNSYLEKLYHIKEDAHYRDAEGVFKGKIIGVNQSGRLLIEREGGIVSTYAFKEVEYL
jgi:BirA family transcriptional regulator, biotin operon repressor / biotin---[acetyl-CoA-carboxylase] ligase